MSDQKVDELIEELDALVLENERLEAEVDFLRGNQTVCLEEINRLRAEIQRYQGMLENQRTTTERLLVELAATDKDQR